MLANLRGYGIMDRMKRVIVIQDLCCVGQCSLTVSLPILSACCVEACALPVQLLSTHSVGFEGYSRCGLEEQAMGVVESLKRQGVRFDGALVGYLGSLKAVELANKALELINDDAIIIVDPAMADYGELYPDLEEGYVDEIAKLCERADYILPNMDEARLLSGQADYLAAFNALEERFKAKCVITGIDLGEQMGVMYGELIRHQKFDRPCHGAGDVFTAAFAGLAFNLKDRAECAKVATEFTLECIRNTLADEKHFYGLHFEECLGMLTKRK